MTIAETFKLTPIRKKVSMLFWAPDVTSSVNLKRKLREIGLLLKRCKSTNFTLMRKCPSSSWLVDFSSKLALSTAG